MSKRIKVVVHLSRIGDIYQQFADQTGMSRRDAKIVLYPICMAT